MTNDFRELHLQLTTHRDSPPLTVDDKDALIEFCRDELDASGDFELHAFEDYTEDTHGDS